MGIYTYRQYQNCLYLYYIRFPMKKILFTLLLMPCVLSAQNIITVAGSGNTTLGDNGPATNANLKTFGQIAINSNGDIIIAANNDQRIRKVDASTGIITTIGGTGVVGYSGDNGPATAAKFSWPNFVACDNSNNVYISDDSNRIRRIDVASGIVTTIAGNGIPAFAGDGGPATDASINRSEGITFDVEGNLFFVDDNNARVRKINTAGIISTVAGNGTTGFSGDGGQATSAQIRPWSISFDNFGKLYIADDGVQVRKVDLNTGTITTVVGDGSGVYNGENIPATATGIRPVKVTFDINNRMFVSDGYSNRVRMVDSVGIIHTVAGTGISGFSGDGGPATAAQFYTPSGIEYYCGNIYIADAQNHRVRKIAYNISPDCPTLSISNPVIESVFNVFPNPVTTNLTITSTNVITNVSISNIIGQTVYSNYYHREEVQVNIADLPKGIYFIKVNGTEVRKFVKE